MTESATATAARASGGEMSVETVLALFDGDPYAALEAALTDIADMERDLAVARMALSRGFTRGWTPG